MNNPLMRDRSVDYLFPPHQRRWTEQERAENFLAGEGIGVESFGDFYASGVLGVDEGFVYFVTLGEPVEWVKIGFTTKHPLARLKMLQTGCPYRLKMHGFILAPKDAERQLHFSLTDYRGEGEWFRWVKPVRELIEARLNDEPI